MTVERARPATLKDIAQRAGVSISTVSRVLDERLPSSRSEAADRVRLIAAELGYSRDVLASSLRRQGTDTIGVLVPRLTDTVMAVLFEAIARECDRRGQFAVVSATGDDEDRDVSAADALLRRKVDGLILTTARTDMDTTAALRDRGIPHVFALRTDGVTASAIGDDALGGFVATRHLIDLGHTDIGIVGGPTYASSAAGRMQGWNQALHESGITARDDRRLSLGFQIEDGERGGMALLDRADRPTAIFAVNDNTALGVLAAAHRLGLRVPEDVSIVGYNDIPLASHLPVPLTTVRVPFERVAADAVDLLLETPQTDRIRVVQPTLIPRGTTTRPT
jgi:LacI family transcriptional regulator